MPAMPAIPKNRAYSDQPRAASTPTLMSVSIVAAPCRRFIHAARWNGHAPHNATGPASASASHCQFVNCRAGIIDIATTGTVSTVDTIRRCRRDAASPLISDEPTVSSDSGGGGAGSSAV